METTVDRLSTTRRLRLLSVYILCAIPVIVFGARQAMQSNANSPLEWVGEAFPPRAEYSDFVERFGPGDTLLISWDGCTIDQPSLDLLVQALRRADSFAPRMVAGCSAMPLPDAKPCSS